MINLFASSLYYCINRYNKLPHFNQVFRQTKHGIGRSIKSFTCPEEQLMHFWFVNSCIYSENVHCFNKFKIIHCIINHTYIYTYIINHKFNLFGCTLRPHVCGYLSITCIHVSSLNCSHKDGCAQMYKMCLYALSRYIMPLLSWI